jgi:hypothetical protein
VSLQWKERANIVGSLENVAATGNKLSRNGPEWRSTLWRDMK